MALTRVDFDYRGVVTDYVEAVRRIGGMRQHLRQGFFMHVAYQNPEPIKLTKKDRNSLKKEIARVQQRERRLAKMLGIFS